MLPPVRCFTCNAPLSARWYELQDSVGERASDVMDRMGIHRYCCRRMLLTNVDLSSVIKSPHFDLNAESENMTFSAVSSRSRQVNTK